MDAPKPITLAEYLFRRNETLVSLEGRTGVSAPTLSLIKLGQSRPRLDIARAILRACEAEPVEGYCVTIDSLLEPWELRERKQANPEQRSASQG